jgi:hypothetical protein
VLLLDGEESWLIDTRNFSGTPRLRWRLDKERAAIRLQGAYFPASRIRADFDASIRLERFGWAIHLRFKGLNWNFTGSLEAWLRQRVSLVANPQRDVSPFIFRHLRLNLARGGAIYMSPEWEFTLVGPAIAHAVGRGFDANPTTPRCD